MTFDENKPMRPIMISNLPKSPREKFYDCIAICKKGKNKKYGKKGGRRIWTRSKAYKTRVQEISFVDDSIVRRYYVETNSKEIDVLDQVEFRQRFKIFVKV